MPGSAGPYRGIRANNEQTPERAILAPFLLRRRPMWDGKGGQPLIFAKRMFPPTCVPHAGPGQTGPESGVRSLCGRWARRIHRCSVCVGESPMVGQPGGQVRGQPSRWLLALAHGCGCLHRGCCAFDTMMGMSDDRDDSEVARLRRQGGPLSAGALAEQAGWSTSAVTSVIDRAERSRNLRRLSDAKDRRRVLVEVTELGRQRGREAFSGLMQGTDRLLRSYSPEELRLLGGFVEEVRSVVAGQATEAASAAIAARGHRSGRRAGR